MSQGRSDMRRHEERSLVKHGAEATLASCGGHLGHLFDDGPGSCDHSGNHSVALGLDHGRRA